MKHLGSCREMLIELPDRVAMSEEDRMMAVQPNGSKTMTLHHFEIVFASTAW